MLTTQEDRLQIYNQIIPRLNWFNRDEQLALVAQAEENAKRYGANFITTLENLTYMKSFEKGRSSV